MAGFTQSVQCMREYADGTTAEAWTVKMYVPAADYAAFIAKFDRVAAGAFKYYVLFDQTPVSRKPRFVQRWTD